MRAVQIFFGLLIVIIGLFLLLLTSGLITLTMLDLVGCALILSGLFFWIPGIAGRRAHPWLTALFIPGTLTFAIGAGLMYTQRTEAGLGAWTYLWTILLVALGIALLAMYWLGPRAASAFYSLRFSSWSFQSSRLRVSWAPCCSSRLGWCLRLARCCRGNSR